MGAETMSLMTGGYNMETEKALKLYSLNLVSFVMLYSKIEPVVDVDESGVARFYFPETEQVKFLIKLYRSTSVSVSLKDYLNTFRKVREMARVARSEKD